MKKILLFTLAFCLLVCCKQGEKAVTINTSAGDMVISPTTDNSIRVQIMGAPTHEVENLIFTEEVEIPDFEVVENETTISVITAKMKAVFDKDSETLAFYDA